VGVRVACPICSAETVWQGNPYRPFCSRRCRLRDLGNWLGERYRIAGTSLDRADAPDDGDEEDQR
jgi:endogenous inhibitor of DNA gyrase (YacG/DUF329 family)